MLKRIDNPTVEKIPGTLNMMLVFRISIPNFLLN